jgi:hypothetical protein
MNLLFTGRGRAGSWQIRGEQLGRAIGAVIDQAPSLEACRAADAIVVVKKVSEQTLATIRQSGRPWAYDILDCYPQPGCSAWSAQEAIGWIRHRLRKLAPSAVIWPNHRMRQDCDVGVPSLVLPHHYRPGIHQNPIRAKVTRIGYEGATAYLSQWRTAIVRECVRRSWTFIESPPHLADLDIVLAVRGGEWDCYATAHWKSNVKLANAHGSGTPFVGQPECGYLETGTCAEYWAEEPADLGVCFDWLVPQATRAEVSQRFLAKAYSVDQASADLKAFLDGL